MSKVTFNSCDGKTVNPFFHHFFLFSSFKIGSKTLDILGVLTYYGGKTDIAASFISAAAGSDGLYLPVMYNGLLLTAFNNPEPDDNIRQGIKIMADSFYQYLAMLCDSEKTYSVPPHVLAEFITIPRVDDSYKNRKYYLRGHALLHEIRKVVPGYEPPVKFKSDY